MVARHIDNEGGVFLLIFIVLVLFLENPLVRLLRKIFKENERLVTIIDVCIMIILARFIRDLIWYILF